MKNRLEFQAKFRWNFADVDWLAWLYHFIGSLILRHERLSFSYFFPRAENGIALNNGIFGHPAVQIALTFLFSVALSQWKIPISSDRTSFCGWNNGILAGNNLALDFFFLYIRSWNNGFKMKVYYFTRYIYRWYFEWVYCLNNLVGYF